LVTSTITNSGHDRHLSSTEKDQTRKHLVFLANDSFELLHYLLVGKNAWS